jgi:hypothetical protein
MNQRNRLIDVVSINSRIFKWLDGVIYKKDNLFIHKNIKIMGKDGILNNPENQGLEKATKKEICGQSDLVEIVNGRVNIIDYKTNKKIDTASYTDWEGKSEKMLPPIDSLDDCNFNHYALQLSIYMYIILKHNPKLKPGKIFIHHIVFEVEKENEWGYPITKKDVDGEPIVKEVNQILVPYLADEVIAIFHYLHDYRDKIKKK